MSEQEIYKKMLKKMIAKAEDDSIQTSEQLIQALIFEMSMKNKPYATAYETSHA